ncbi:unnamed protein product, partial [Amoebophrya sp. A25]
PPATRRKSALKGSSGDDFSASLVLGGKSSASKKAGGKARSRSRVSFSASSDGGGEAKSDLKWDEQRIRARSFDTPFYNVDDSASVKELEREEARMASATAGIT